MEGYHILIYIYSVSHVSNVVILEGREDMDPLFDSVVNNNKPTDQSGSIMNEAWSLFLYLLTAFCVWY